MKRAGYIPGMTLKEWRTSQGYSLRKAAEQLMISAATLSRIENGNRPLWETAFTIDVMTHGRVKRDELMALNGASE